MISMAKSMTVGKRENEKKRLAKREEKLKKKESKKLSGKANSFEEEGLNFLMRLGDLALLKILTVLKSISSM